jgi:hypothetical protein
MLEGDTMAAVPHTEHAPLDGYTLEKEATCGAVVGEHDNLSKSDSDADITILSATCIANGSETRDVCSDIVVRIAGSILPKPYGDAPSGPHRFTVPAGETLQLVCGEHADPNKTCRVKWTFKWV